LRLLLDTHIAFWLASDYSRLKPGELAAALEPDNDIAVSAASIWELRIKWFKHYRSGERKGPADPLELLVAFKRMNIPVLALSAEHSATGLHHQINHQDPFDELLLTVAQEMGCKLLTRDKNLRGHPLAFHAS
jgi:PIN domain nuclease of toxin-antitoxin system